MRCGGTAMLQAMTRPHLTLTLTLIMQSFSSCLPVSFQSISVGHVFIMSEMNSDLNSRKHIPQCKSNPDPNADLLTLTFTNLISYLDPSPNASPTPQNVLAPHDGEDSIAGNQALW